MSGDPILTRAGRSSPGFGRPRVRAALPGGSQRGGARANGLAAYTRLRSPWGAILRILAELA